MTQYFLSLIEAMLASTESGEHCFLLPIIDVLDEARTTPSPRLPNNLTVGSSAPFVFDHGPALGAEMLVSPRQGMRHP